MHIRDHLKIPLSKSVVHNEAMSSAIIHAPEAIGDNELLFRMHARKDDYDLVSASVFAAKLSNLIKALHAADRSVNNGQVVHDYKIAKLKSSSPTVLLCEARLPKFASRFDIAPAIPAMDACLSAVIEGQEDQARQFGNCAAVISRLATGADKRFGYAEVWTGARRVYRVDNFLHDQATAASTIRKAAEIANDQWFRGAVFGSFDGHVQFVDTRGELPEIKLTLSAGHQEIDCVCRADQIDQIGASINKRVRIYGRAIYDGSNGLPRRVEISNIEPVATDVDFTKWKGSFKPFSPSPWPDGDE